MPRFAIFGDSHYACLRQAQTQGLVDVSGIDLEYWGHIGHRFNHLEVRDGALHPTDDFTASRFAKFNEKGRLFLPAADFDVVLFAGARTYLGSVVRPILAASVQGPFLTSGLIRRMLRDHLRAQSGYHFARAFAATGTARILLSPVAFPTQGVPQYRSDINAPACAASVEAQQNLWQLIVDIAATDGITFLAQPPETIVDAVFTKEDFAIPDTLPRKDFEHRNAAYGALVLSQALAHLRSAGDCAVA